MGQAAVLPWWRVAQLRHPHKSHPIHSYVVDVLRSRGRRSRWLEDQEECWRGGPRSGWLNHCWAQSRAILPDNYRTQDLRPAPTDAPRDRLNFVVGPLQPVGSESVGLTQGTRTPATTNLATRRQQCGGPRPTRRFGKCGPDGGEHEPPPPRADRGEALGRCPRRWTAWRRTKPSRPQGHGGGGM